MPDVDNSAAEEKTTMTSAQLQQLDELGTITENTISAEQDIINKFGIRQEVIIKNDKEDKIREALKNPVNYDTIKEIVAKNDRYNTDLVKKILSE